MGFWDDDSCNFNDDKWNLGGLINVTRGAGGHSTIGSNNQVTTRLGRRLEKVEQALENIENILLNDKMIRDNNDFVRELYEQYQVALQLAKDEEDFKDTK